MKIIQSVLKPMVFKGLWCLLCVCTIRRQACTILLTFVWALNCTPAHAQQQCGLTTEGRLLHQVKTLIRPGNVHVNHFAKLANTNKLFEIQSRFAPRLIFELDMIARHGGYAFLAYQHYFIDRFVHSSFKIRNTKYLCYKVRCS